jgi:NAD(P)-dependent dehydrogenase (short-subunit alcohol dehydrogenase family)
MSEYGSGWTSRAVLITGCSSGIGWSTAERLSRRGWTVYATARNVEEVERIEGAVGVLINNAGYSQSGAIEEVPMEKVRRQFETNFFGLVRMCQLALPGMREQGFGRIVNLSSMGGRLTFPGGGFYHASKHAVEAVSDALRFEVRDFGVDVVVIEPGLIHTGFVKTAVGSMGEGSGPYAGFEAAVAQATRENYERGPLAALGGGPETVAEVIERAISTALPLHGHALGEAVDLRAAAPAGPGLGRPRGTLLPPARRVAQHSRESLPG